MHNWFYKRRKELDMSQFDVAVKIGMTPGTVALWEKDRLIPSPPIAKLAEVYQATEVVIERQLIRLRRAIEAAEAEAAVTAKE